MNLALFDFDGTITTCDTFTPFIKKVVLTHKMRLGKLLILPYVLGYRAGILSASLVRQKVIYVGLKGFSKSRLEYLGKVHADEFLGRVVRKNALERINWHLKAGDRVIVVSASLDVYLKPWCDELGLELISSQLQANGDILTGRYLHGDCTGSIKAERVKSLVNLNEYDKIYAYGDTKEDDELLSIADQKYFRWEKMSY